MIEFFLMTHVLFGMLCIVMAVWVFVDVLHISEANYSRIKNMTYRDGRKSRFITQLNKRRSYNGNK